ncbi:MAG: peptidase T [Odoribacteraceae bacterium]|jgi:tripeptide aminopeptidase|nr:peptidase T [Odoribacteraceae bacterium]
MNKEMSRETMAFERDDEGLLERFLKYVSFDTGSDESSDTFPSTVGQTVFARYLAGEMVDLGMSEVEIDVHGYVTGTIPATPGYEEYPVIGFIAHLDTSPDASGAGVRPRVIDKYDGGDIRLNEEVVTRVSVFPELSRLVGHALVVTDGTTLLGADDKAGIAEIMTAAGHLLRHPGVPHGKVRVAFTPDEEIGRGVDFFDVERFGAAFAYTVDGGEEGALEYDNFNAAGARVVISGRGVHPGSAKGKMINALQVAVELNAFLPSWQRPEYTAGHEGFYHLTRLDGTVERAVMNYIIRDHDRGLFEEKKEYLARVARMLNEKYGERVVALETSDQYYNMRASVEACPGVLDRARRAMMEAGVTPVTRPVRGGTDGARLSFMGLPCPNLFTGGINFHGRFECCSIDSMRRAARVIVNLSRA